MLGARCGTTVVVGSKDADSVHFSFLFPPPFCCVLSKKVEMKTALFTPDMHCVCAFGAFVSFCAHCAPSSSSSSASSCSCSSSFCVVFRHRREQRGDAEGVIRFLHEFTQSQMFHMHMMHVKVGVAFRCFVVVVVLFFCYKVEELSPLLCRLCCLSHRANGKVL